MLGEIKSCEINFECSQFHCYDISLLSTRSVIVAKKIVL